MSKKKTIKKVAPKKAEKKTTKKVAKPAATKKVAKAPKKEAKKATTKKVEKKTTAKKVEKKVATKKAAPKKAIEKKLPAVKKVKAEKKSKEKKVKAPKQSKDELKKNAKQSEVETKEKKGRNIDEEEEVPLVNLNSKEKVIDAITDEISDEVANLSEDYKLKDIYLAFRSLNYFKVNTDECLEKNCDTPATTEGYCRYHYIRNWQDIKKRQAILKDGRLQDLIEDLVTKYPLKHLESILSDLQDEKSFFAILSELNIDEVDEDGFDGDDEGLDDDSDIAFETRTTIKSALGED